METLYYSNSNNKNTEVSMLKSENPDFKAKSIMRQSKKLMAEFRWNVCEYAPERKADP